MPRNSNQQKLSKRVCACLLNLNIFFLLFLTVSVNHVSAQDVEKTAEVAVNAENLQQKSELAENWRQKSLNQTKGIIGQDNLNFKSVAGQSVKGLLYCGALLLLVFAGLKKYGAGRLKEGEESAIEIISKRPLGGRTALLLVRAEGQKFLLSQSGDEVSLLTEIEPTPRFVEELEQEEVRQLNQAGEVKN